MSRSDGGVTGGLSGRHDLSAGIYGDLADYCGCATVGGKGRPTGGRDRLEGGGEPLTKIGLFIIQRLRYF